MTTRSVAAALLVLEAITIALAAPVAITISDVRPAVAFPVFLGLALFAVVVSGMLRSPRGYVLGWVVQVLALASALLVPAMAVIALVFGLLWWTVLRLGRRIEAEQAAYREANPPEQAA